MCSLRDFKHLELTPQHAKWLEEELAAWHSVYLPCGSTVLDVGAGCGETAQFYLNHGARRVIAIEGDRAAFELLCKNFANDLRVVPVFGRLDTVKVDIEGAEENMVVESHFPAEWRPVHQWGEPIVEWQLKRVQPQEVLENIDALFEQ